MALPDRVDTVAPSAGTFTNRSGSIATAATAQVAAPQNLGRRYLLIQAKVANTESFWVDFDGTSAVLDSPSIEVAPGVTFTFEDSFVPSGAISVIAATLGTKFTIKEA